MTLLLKKENVWICIIALLFILINAKLTTLGYPWLNFLPVLLWFFICVIFKLDILMFILIAIVPLSVPLSEIFKNLPVNLYLPTEPIIIGIMLLFFIKLIYEDTFDERIIKHPVTLAIFFNLIWIFITCFTSEIPLVSFKFFISRLWFVIVFYFIATQLFSKYRNIIKYNWLYIAGLLIVICYFIIRLNKNGISDRNAANWVVSPFYNDHTAYAAALSMLLPFIIGLIFIRRKASWPVKLIYIFFVFIFFNALVLSYTRAAWLSLLAACIFLFPLLLKIKLKYIFLTLIVITGLFFAFKDQIFISLERNKQDSSQSLSKHIISAYNIKSDASNLERINRWKCALRMFEKRPFFGFGPGTYQFNYAPFQKKEDETIISTNAGNLGNAHSEYLGPLSESGILGTLSFILIVITTMITASKIYFRSKRRKVRLMALVLLIGLITYYAHGLLNNFLDTDKLSALFWGFTAMIVALDVYHFKEKESNIEGISDIK